MIPHNLSPDLGATNPLEQATEALLTVDDPGSIQDCVELWCVHELIGLFSFVGQQLSIDFCTNNEKEPVSILSSTSLRLFMIHRHLASKMDMILTDKCSLIESNSGAFPEINSQSFLQPVKVILTKLVRLRAILEHLRR